MLVSIGSLWPNNVVSVLSLTNQEDWATVYKGWKVCRIDGSTSQESRREQMNEFNEGGDSPDATKLFLLSTRAGGLGVNLVAAE